MTIWERVGLGRFPGESGGGYLGRRSHAMSLSMATSMAITAHIAKTKWTAARSIRLDSILMWVSAHTGVIAVTNGGRRGREKVEPAAAQDTKRPTRKSSSGGRTGDLNLPELEALAEKCRGEIASCPIPVEGKQVSGTVSVGAALLRKGEPADSAVQRADELLYVAKCQGGNAVRVEV